MRKETRFGLIAALALASLPAAAADNGVYLGGSIGLSGVEDGSIDYDADSTGYKLIAGWRFLDWLAVEGNYVDFGSSDDDNNILGETLKVDASALSLSAVGFLPVGPVDLFARVGLISWDADLEVVGFGRAGEDGTDLTYGVGAQFRLGSLAFRGEYELFDFDGTDVDLFSVGITWTFF
jgi:hypothetical protein